MSQITGTVVVMALITDKKREQLGDSGAFNRAALRLLQAYNSLTLQDKKGITYRLALTVDDTNTCCCISYHKRTGRHTAMCPQHETTRDPAPHLTQAQKDAGYDGK
jgi:hypothetical protein